MKGTFLRQGFELTSCDYNTFTRLQTFVFRQCWIRAGWNPIFVANIFDIVTWNFNIFSNKKNLNNSMIYRLNRHNRTMVQILICTSVSYQTVISLIDVYGIDVFFGYFQVVFADSFSSIQTICYQRFPAGIKTLLLIHIGRIYEFGIIYFSIIVIVRVNDTYSTFGVIPSRTIFEIESVPNKIII